MNPLRRESEMVAHGEDRSFAREFLKSPSQAVIRYYPPLPDGHPIAGRPFLEVELQAKGPWYGRRPFFWELISPPVSRSAGGAPDHDALTDRLHIVLDRYVKAVLPASRNVQVPRWSTSI